LGYPDSTAAGSSSRELALFNLEIDSKLRGCELVGLRVHDVIQGSQVSARAIVMQKKTQRPVQFEITEQTQEAVAAWVQERIDSRNSFCFRSLRRTKPTLIYRDSGASSPTAPAPRSNAPRRWKRLECQGQCAYAWREVSRHGDE
jgi:hypothetical protein